MAAKMSATMPQDKPLDICDDNEKGKLDESDNVSGHEGDTSYTPAETRRSVLKVDLCILPFIMLCFCFLQFDRTNISNALTDTLRTDINVGNADINLAQTLFTVGFIITEIPFNIVSKRIGPERFLPITMVFWGITTWSQIFIKSASGLYAARFFVGALEGGYIPGFALYISRYYTNRELGLRFALFWASNSFAGALAGPLAIGLLSLRGRGGLAGWQWLFLVGEHIPISFAARDILITCRRYPDLCSWGGSLYISPTQRCHTQSLLRKLDHNLQG
jgi:MFS family permease